jgi:hypothetical protein
MQGPVPTQGPARLSACIISAASDSVTAGEVFDVQVVASRMNARKNLEGICPATVIINSMFSGAPEHLGVEASSTLQSLIESGFGIRT